jgi:NADPH:quinone reductase-like Zn-dependent oxidoreductase
MKAILYSEYGPPEALRFAEVEQPKPTEKQVLVRVHAASVNALEWRGFTMSSLLLRLLGGGLFKPKDPKMGVDVAGTVEAVGNGVTEFKPGDAVFGVAPGSFAEYACNGESKFVLKPANVSFEAAAAVPVAGLTALQGLRDKGQLQPGQRVLIDGASGGVGMYAVQIAKTYGAEVTAVCSTRNLETARAFGADHLIDYKMDDFTRNGQHYDLILAVNGHHSMRDYRRALRPMGKCVVVGGPLSQVLQALLLGRFVSRPGGKRHLFMVATTLKKDLLVLGDLLEAGKLVPMIDRSYPLSRAAEAIRYLIDEHARGKVVITMEPASRT